MPENPHYIERLTDKRLDTNVLHAFLRTLALQDERLLPYVDLVIQATEKSLGNTPEVARFFPVYVACWNHKDLIPSQQEGEPGWASGVRQRIYPHITVFSYFNDQYPQMNSRSGLQLVKVWLVSDGIEELPGLEAAIQPTRDAWVAVIKSSITGTFQWSA
jgi:hypothetical protein